MDKNDLHRLVILRKEVKEALELLTPIGDAPVAEVKVTHAREKLELAFEISASP